MKRFKVIFILFCLIVVASFSLYAGFYFNNLNKPENIIGRVIDGFDSKTMDFLSDNNNYYLGDNYSISSKIDFNLTSEDYTNKSKTDKEAEKKVKFLKNISLLDTDISFKQDFENKQVFFSINGKLGSEQLINYKYLIDNSTEYYNIENITKGYVNNGTSNFFEAIDKDNSSKDNYYYLHDFIISSLKNNIKSEYITTYNVTENINNSNKEVNQISLKIRDKEIHKILNGILNDLKNDEKANKILTSIDEDFDKTKIKDKTEFLKKNEYYTLNIYTSKHLSKILKYELIHLDGDNKEIITYEGDSEVGNIYYIENDKVMYQIDVVFSDKNYSFEIHNSKSENIGKIKIDKDTDRYNFSMDFNDGKKKYEIVYSSKYLDVKKNKSFSNDKELSIKLIDNKVSILNGTISIKSNVTKDVSIDENISNAVLSSSLSADEKAKIDKERERIEERLKK